MAAFVVTNLNDSGPGSLRQMVLDANAAAGADTIDFAVGLAGTLTLTTGELVLTDDVTINGDNTGDDRADITISGNNTSRIFSQSLAGTDTVLQSLTLTNGGATGSSGGAVLAAGGSLTIQDSTVQNSTANQGGGVYSNIGTILTITNSLISGNTTVNSGAGIFSGGAAFISNTTVADNTSLSGSAGGIFVSGTTTIQNSTIVSNHAAASIQFNAGGGGLVITNFFAVSVSNTVFSDNTSGSAFVERDVAFSSSNVMQSTNNVFDDASVGFLTGTGNQFNVDDAGLGVLQDNGGTVNTFAPEAGSPLINAGSNTAAAGLATDANGNARIVGGTVDVGASEFVGVLTVTNLNDSGAGSLRDAVEAANLNADFNEIVFQAGLTGSIAVLNTLTLTNNVSINGDTNGDGDFDITLTDDDVSVNIFNVINVAAGSTAELTSLSISGVASALGAGVIQNAGDLTINYLVLADNHLGIINAGVAHNYAPVLNSGVLAISQTAFTENIVNGTNGRPGLFSPGGAGGSASASILNFAPGQVTATAMAVVGGMATGGNGGAGSVTLPSPYFPSTGLPGGNGGNASLGIMNGGTFSGTGNFVGAGTATAGLGGAGGTGTVGGTAASGLAGLSSLTNLNLGAGTGSLAIVQTGTDSADTVSGIATGQKYYGLGLADNITGDQGSLLYGGTGHDVLTSLGYSKLYGGLGNDVLRNTFISIYFGAGTWDGGGGTDTFDASLSVANYGVYVDLSTGANNFGGTLISIENLTGTNSIILNDGLTGSNGVNTILGLAGTDFIHGLGSNDVLNGGADDDFLFGDGDDDRLIGGTGVDAMDGGQGNDTIYVDNAADVVVEAVGGGVDSVLASVSYALSAGAEIERLLTTSAAAVIAINLTGNAFGQEIYGNNGINTLNGGIDSVRDILTGYGGNDIYIINSSNDFIVEDGGGGASDRVQAAVSFVLASDDNIEILQTTNSLLTTAINLTGNGVAQAIYGNAGSNILSGGIDGVRDTLIGYGGNDIYVIHTSTDLIAEGVGQGLSDRVRTSVTFALTADDNIEIMQTINAAYTDAIDLTGNVGIQTIYGNEGANALNGGLDSARDILVGYGGNDTYFVNSTTDLIVEAAGGGNIDAVYTTVSFTLAADDDIELLYAANLLATTALNLTGNALVQQIVGNEGANTLNGGFGNDILYGNLGTDKFLFNTALVAGNNFDSILDFTVADDTILLENAIFTELAVTGTLSASLFEDTSVGGQNGSELVIYDRATGDIYYDTNGVGTAGGLVTFATVADGTVLTNAEFVVI